MAGQPFIFQLTEALTALSIPLGGGLAAYAKWRKGAERDRRAREEGARIAAEKAASDARREEQNMRDRLLAEKDARITQLSEQLTEEQAETKQLQRYVEKLLSEKAQGSGTGRQYE
jgi:uncharacterized protein HemX